jgi:4-carboxymuconolactone decarboxylase
MIDRGGFIGGTAAVLAAGSTADAQPSGERPGIDPALPADVYASSRNRAPLITRDMIAGEENRTAYDGIVNGGTLAGLQGPAGISLYSTKLNRAAAALNGALRVQSGLERRLAELAILVSARESNSAFEWNAHERVARTEGLSDEVIDVVRNRKTTSGLGEKEAAIITLGREAIGKHAVSPKTYATAQRLFGTEVLVNLCLLMGDYFMNALLLHVFDQQLPPGVTSTLPVP